MKLIEEIKEILKMTIKCTNENMKEQKDPEFEKGQLFTLEWALNLIQQKQKDELANETFSSEFLMYHQEKVIELSLLLQNCNGKEISLALNEMSTEGLTNIKNIIDKIIYLR